MNEQRIRYPIWARGDLDGFFGLMVDNLAQVLLIIALCTTVAHLPNTLIFGRILPGVAISLLVGNVFYGLQGHYSARKHRNPTCTALPYGINTPSVVAYVLFIMGPVYEQNKAALGEAGASTLAWQAGLLACLVSGIIEATGALYAERLRRVTPRAALLGVLAALGVAFIAAEFAYRIYTAPLVGVLPLAFLLLAYFARYRFPLGIPGGFLAILFGTLIAWAGTWFGFESFGGVHMSGADLRASLDHVHWIAPLFAGHELWQLLQQQPQLVLMFLTVSVPMGVINVLGSLQNIESAEAGGDRFHTGASLAMNGLGTIAAGLFGSCFPTTIYIGHPGWKALGARSGYSILNGVFFTVLFLFGLGPMLAALVPIEAGSAIVMYIGIIITAQAFQVTKREHAPAVAVALFPALAATLVITLANYFIASGSTVTLADFMHRWYTDPTMQKAFYLPGLLALTGANSGWLIVTLILAAIGAALIDHKYKAATIWAAAGAVLTLIGAVHAYRLEGNVIREFFIWQKSTSASAVAYRAFPIAVSYGLATLLFGLAAWRESLRREGNRANSSNPPSATELPVAELVPSVSEPPALELPLTEAAPATVETYNLQPPQDGNPS
jgi:AGZA family xanthine/uracil permease-like MFS transporter